MLSRMPRVSSVRVSACWQHLRFGGHEQHVVEGQAKPDVHESAYVLRGRWRAM
jgi:hypothetical protein